MKIPIFPGKYRQNGGFSIAMLDYRTVYIYIDTWCSFKSMYLKKASNMDSWIISCFFCRHQLPIPSAWIYWTWGWKKVNQHYTPTWWWVWWWCSSNQIRIRKKSPTKQIPVYDSLWQMLDNLGILFPAFILWVSNPQALHIWQFLAKLLVKKSQNSDDVPTTTCHLRIRENSKELLIGASGWLPCIHG